MSDCKTKTPSLKQRVQRLEHKYETLQKMVIEHGWWFKCLRDNDEHIYEFVCKQYSDFLEVYMYFFKCSNCSHPMCVFEDELNEHWQNIIDNRTKDQQ